MNISKERFAETQCAINELMSEHKNLLDWAESHRTNHELNASRLASMRNERDEIQNRLQAIDHAYAHSQEVCRISGEEIRILKAENSEMKKKLSCAFTINNRMKAAQRAVCDWLVPDGIRARTAMERLLPILDDRTIVVAQDGLLGIKPE